MSIKLKYNEAINFNTQKVETLKTSLTMGTANYKLNKAIDIASTYKNTESHIAILNLVKMALWWESLNATAFYENRTRIFFDLSMMSEFNESINDFQDVNNLFKFWNGINWIENIVIPSFDIEVTKKHFDAWLDYEDYLKYLESAKEYIDKNNEPEITDTKVTNEPIGLGWVALGGVLAIIVYVAQNLL